jgi:hypothetical protein
MTGKPETFIQRTYQGVSAFGPDRAVLSLRKRSNPLIESLFRARLDEAAAGTGDIEYIICEHVDEHDCNVVFRSTPEFDEALDALFACPPGHYMVAVRP